MHSMLIYCRSSDATRTDTLGPWLEQQAAALCAQPGVQRATVVRLTGQTVDGPREQGWLVDCKLLDSAREPGSALGEMLTDMRLIGFDPTVFTAHRESSDHV